MSSNIKAPKGVPAIALPEWLLNEKLERALTKSKGVDLKIDDLFLVIPHFEEGEVKIETKYGWLRVFFCKELKEFQKYDRKTPQGLLLSHKKYEYPKISRIKVVKN